MPGGLEAVDPQGETVPNYETGYAVTFGSLRVDGDRFELDLSPEEMQVVRAAVEWDEETSYGLVESVSARRDDPIGFKGITYRGDLSALRQIVGALERYEKAPDGAGFLEDKVAYDARTAFNHAEPAVRKLMEGED